MPGLGLDAALGRLAAGAAHELNNPLFAVLGLLELVLADPTLAEKQRGRLELAVQTGLEMKETLRALVEVARASSERTLVDLAEIGARAVDVVRRTTASRDVEFASVSADRHVHVVARPAELLQVLVDLLTAATRALPRGGRVTLDVRRDASDGTIVVCASGPDAVAELPRAVADVVGLVAERLGGRFGVTRRPRGVEYELRAPAAEL